MTPIPASLGFVEGVAQPLEKRFEVIKDVGDGSFGSVVLARVRGTRNMVLSHLSCLIKVAIKSMKKSFGSFSECLRLREVQVPTWRASCNFLESASDSTTS
jgi:serine/threonine protein kinase